MVIAFRAAYISKPSGDEVSGLFLSGVSFEVTGIGNLGFLGHIEVYPLGDS